MCFFDKFTKLCKEKGVSETRALIDAGLSKSLRTKWAKKPETIPNGETITKLCNYFGVPSSFFLDDDIKKAPTDYGERDEMTEELIALFNSKTKEQREAILQLLRSSL